MFPRRYQILIWLCTSLVVHSQYQTEENIDAIETTIEPISQNDTEYEISTLPANNYQNKYSICNYKNTCGEINSAEKNVKDGLSPACMCDENCSSYDDCCSDAKYRNKNQSNFVCTKTSFDGNIYTKDTCEFESNDIISNLCINQSIDNKINIFSTIPVTSKSTNITYANFFCALCNNEKNFRFWDVALISDFQSNITRQDVNEMFLHDDFFSDHFDKRLASNYTIHTKIPDNLLSLIRYCIPDEIKNCLRDGMAGMEHNCFDVSIDDSIDDSNKNDSSFSQCFSNNMDTKNITIVKARNIPFRFCEMIPADNSAFRVLCQKNTLEQSFDKSSQPDLTYIENCFFQTIDGESCLINSFFQSDEFKIIDNETIYVYKYKRNFPKKEWSLEGNNSSVYICGTEIPLSLKDNIFKTLTGLCSTVLISTSIFFLILYIIMYNSVKKLRYPFSKVILCYSISLLMMFVLLLLRDWESSCNVIGALTHYFFLSCFTWLVVASFECWRTVTASTNTRNKKEHTWTRFGIYCAVGWILPMSIVFVAIYFELSSTESISCPLKPGYGRLKQCFIAQVLPTRYFFYYPSWIMFLINIYFFIHITIYVFCNSSIHRNFSIFAKLALVTGIPWTMNTIVTLFADIKMLKLIYVILNSSQGIFIFFVFGYDKEIITNAFKKVYNHFKNSEKESNRVVTFKVTPDIQTSRSTVKEYF